MSNTTGQILPGDAPYVGVTQWPKQSDVAAFFGKIALKNDGTPTESWQSSYLTTISLPFPFRLSWEPETIVRRMTCHRVVAKAMANTLNDIWEYYGKDIEKIRAAGVDLYGGCYNFRRMRGLGSLSMHAYGIAIDINPDANPLGAKWKDDGKMMPQPVIDIFAKHGATWGGLWQGRPDPQHFQFTQPV